MSREKPHYRDIIAELREQFGKDIVRLSDICKVKGYTPNQVRSRFTLDKGGYITIEQMAFDLTRNF